MLKKELYDLLKGENAKAYKLHSNRWRAETYKNKKNVIDVIYDEQPRKQKIWLELKESYNKNQKNIKFKIEVKKRVIEIEKIWEEDNEEKSKYYFYPIHIGSISQAIRVGKIEKREEFK